MNKLFFAAALLMLSGCATVFAPSKDVITVNSDDKDTKIFADGNFIGTGTAQYTIPRGKSAMLTAEKKGCASQVMQTEKSLVGITFLNILFWPGFIVDAATGAIQKTDPTIYKVRPNCQN